MFVCFFIVWFFASLAPSFWKKSWLKMHNLFWMALWTPKMSPYSYKWEQVYDNISVANQNLFWIENSFLICSFCVWFKFNPRLELNVSANIVLFAHKALTRNGHLDLIHVIFALGVIWGRIYSSHPCAEPIWSYIWAVQFLARGPIVIIEKQFPYLVWAWSFDKPSYPNPCWFLWSHG